MDDMSGAVFVFEAEPPWHVVVYPSIAYAAGSVESLDITDREEAFTVTGQVIKVTSTADLFPRLELTNRVDLARLRTLLRRAPGPAALADNPTDYARRWLREDETDARRAPLINRALGLVTRWTSRRSAQSTGPGSRESLEPCLCCGYRTLPERLAYELCPVCFWEDDPHQADDPHSNDGANGVSLIEAQKAYMRFGAMDPVFLSKVREPRISEERAAHWRPLESRPSHALPDPLIVRTLINASSAWRFVADRSVI